MKRRVLNKKVKQGAGLVISLLDRMDALYREVEEFHRLKEHLLIVLCTGKKRNTLVSNDEEVSIILDKLDKVMFGDKKNDNAAEG